MPSLEQRLVRLESAARPETTEPLTDSNRIARTWHVLAYRGTDESRLAAQRGVKELVMAWRQSEQGA
jgi:hypothetical protein